MTNPITPPPELVQQWMVEPEYGNLGQATLHTLSETRLTQIVTRAAQWGADRELEACCALLELSDDNARDFLYSARRPKPPSLKEQALGAMGRFTTNAHTHVDEMMRDFDIIRRALEQLDD